MTVKEELHQLVELLPEANATEALDYLRWLLGKEDELSVDELALVRTGEEEIARGGFLTLAELKRTLER